MTDILSLSKEVDIPYSDFEEIGKGASAIVGKVSKNGETIAIKLFLRPDLYLSSIQKEFTCISKLNQNNCTNIVKFKEVHKFDLEAMLQIPCFRNNQNIYALKSIPRHVSDVYVFELEYLRGENLEDGYKQLSDYQISSIMKDLLIALMECHRCLIVHNDISLANAVFNNQNGKTVLIDFGCSQEINESSSCLYKCDIYSLGRVFYFLTTRSDDMKFQDCQIDEELTSMLSHLTSCNTASCRLAKICLMAKSSPNCDLKEIYANFF